MDKAEYQRLMESARRSQNIGEWTAALGICIMAGALLFAAVSVYRSGFQITKSNVVTGVPAKILAVILAACSIGGVVFTLVIWPGFLNR